jgi:hypothetical protein
MPRARGPGPHAFAILTSAACYPRSCGPVLAEALDAAVGLEDAPAVQGDPQVAAIADDPLQEPNGEPVQSSVAPKAVRSVPVGRDGSVAAGSRLAALRPYAPAQAWVRWIAADSDPDDYRVARPADDHFVPGAHWVALTQADYWEQARPQDDCSVLADSAAADSVVPMVDGHFVPAGHSAPDGWVARKANGRCAPAEHLARAGCWVPADLAPDGWVARKADGRCALADHLARAGCSVPAGSAAACYRGDCNQDARCALAADSVVLLRVGYLLRVD